MLASAPTAALGSILESAMVRAALLIVVGCITETNDGPIQLNGDRVFRRPLADSRPAQAVSGEDQPHLPDAQAAALPHRNRERNGSHRAGPGHREGCARTLELLRELQVERRCASRSTTAPPSSWSLTTKASSTASIESSGCATARSSRWRRPDPRCPRQAWLDAWRMVGSWLWRIAP